MRHSVMSLKDEVSRLQAILSVRDILDIFCLVLFGNFNVTSTWLQVGGDDFAKLVVFDAESVLDDISDIILPVNRCER